MAIALRSSITIGPPLCDRTYRDAWRRSHNGGPIVIDERKAMAIDEARAWAAYEAARR